MKENQYTIKTVIVDRRSLVNNQDGKGAVMGTVQDHYLAVGELYITTQPKAWGFSISLGTCGNSCNKKLPNARLVAEYVRDNYDYYLSACTKLALPIPQSYLDMCRGSEL